MAWLQKRPQISDSVQFYTIGQNKTVLLVGLGNIGREYGGTRHNIGFMCLDSYVRTHEEMNDWVNKKDLKCNISSGRLGDTQVIAIKPTTFMNLSGEAVQKVSHFFKVANSNIVVIHDDLDIPFGQIRIRVGGEAAGHNGIKSIISTLGEDFGRLRIGIGPKKPEQIDSADFVLQTFTNNEEEQLPNLTREVDTLITEYIYGGNLMPETRSFII